MGYQIPAGYSRVVVEYGAVSTSGSAPCWGFTTDQPPLDISAANLAAWCTDTLAPITTNDYLIERVTMRNDLEFVEAPVGEVGGLGGDGAPPAVAALITMATGLVGRANRGRLYVPGVVLDVAIDGGGNIDAGTVADITDAFEALEALLALADGSFQIGHSTETAPTPVTSWRVENVAATQRRRLRR